MFFILRDVSSLELPPDFDFGRIRALDRTLELGSFAQQGSLKVLSVQISILCGDVWKRIESFSLNMNHKSVSFLQDKLSLRLENFVLPKFNREASCTKFVTKFNFQASIGRSQIFVFRFYRYVPTFWRNLLYNEKFLFKRFSEVKISKYVKLYIMD